jgi:hypothetical protein
MRGTLARRNARMPAHQLPRMAATSITGKNVTTGMLAPGQDRAGHQASCLALVCKKPQIPVPLRDGVEKI